MMNTIVNIIGLPFLIGILLFLLPEKLRLFKGIIATLVTLVTFYWAYTIFNLTNENIDSMGSAGNWLQENLSAVPKYLSIHLDRLNQSLVILTAFFATLICIYSLITINRKINFRDYYAYFLITLGAAIAALLADNLLFFLFMWGILGVTLYKLIQGNNEESAATAKKTLIIVGSSDGIMMLGIAIIWKMADGLNMSEIQLGTNSALPIFAFLFLLIGSFTKAGAFPFHSWIPDFTKNAPASSSAYMPASLDKLLGIYFLVRICKDIFVLNQWLTLVLLIVGSITIITAVMMALVQHNYKKLLGFHAVSQVGYMIVGIALGTALGIAAGLFHMFNNALYKSGLFLTAGNIQHRTGETEIDKLGGLSRMMPLTFFAAIIFSLSISGIPPLNGFASKWMIYQGIIDFGTGTGIANQLWIVWLAFAVFGSALTLASFIKFLSGIFLGSSQQTPHVKEANFLMYFPMLILATICILTGVFAMNYVLPKLLMPVTGDFSFVGIWQSEMVGLLILLSIMLGVIIYLAFSMKKFRREESFIGGETFHEKTGLKVTGFYQTISQAKLLSAMYKAAEKKWFDIYDLSKRCVLSLNKGLSWLHDGILQTYMLWIFIGLGILLLCLL